MFPFIFLLREGKRMDTITLSRVQVKPLGWGGGASEPRGLLLTPQRTVVGGGPQKPEEVKAPPLKG